jgi:hypothetical protein
MAEGALFPRLPFAAARQRLAEIVGKDCPALSRAWSPMNQAAVYSATGGTRVAEEVLVDIRHRLVARAEELGFPDDTRQESRVAFDPIAAQILLEGLPIIPGEAARDDVWAFITLVLLPDLATWRFPKQEERRMLGGVRNVFQRLWWRARLLRDEPAVDKYHLVRLPEDALVGLMERPALSSNPMVAVSIARVVETLATTLPASTREDAWRDAYKRVRQRLAFVNLDALPEIEVAAQIQSCCEPKP